MRPARLELKGFSTFREHTVIDFSNVDLIAFVGPTGSGKSTIIDGIIFALYGSVVRYKANNLVAPIINQLSNEARIRLDFSIGNIDYTAVRVVRRTSSGATTKEARLESSGEVLAGNARELDNMVEQLLGLNFDQFTKTVVLPQGEFARFLTEPPEARQSLLRRLLGMELYRSMGSAARNRSKTAETARSALVEQRADRVLVTEETVAEAAASLASLDGTRQDLVEVVAALDDAKAERTAATERVGRLGEVLELLSELEVPVTVTELTTALDELHAKREDARLAAESSTEELTTALETLNGLPSVDELERLLELHAEADELTSRARDAQATAISTTGQLETATRLELEADSTLVEVEARRDEVRVRAGAAGLRHALTPGEPCPVCEHIVDALPTHDPVAELAELDDAVSAKQDHFRQVREARRNAEQAHANASAELRAIESRCAEVAEALETKPDLKAAATQLRTTREAQSHVDKASKKVEAAQAKLSSIEQQLTSLELESKALQRAFLETRDRLSTLEPPSPSGESPTQDWQELVNWGTTIEAQVQAYLKEAVSDEEAASILVATHETAIEQLCEPHVTPVPTRPLEWIAAEIGRARAELAASEAERAAQAKAMARIAALETEASVSGELGRLLSARGFEQWLMTDVMHTLADRATDRLLELSGGAYSLLTDGTDFSIRDHRNADEVRSARTLSGGETFLASLSLALALADNIAALASHGAPRIESMFLDEGFGTLDVETLDVVASAIEELGAEGRMIGVVTHIRDLADRIPVRFEVSRTPSGSVVERTTLG